MEDSTIPTVHDLFTNPIGGMDERIGGEIDAGLVKTTLRIHPRMGTGEIWYVPLDEASAFFSCSLSLRSPAEVAHPAIDCFFFGAGCMPAAPGTKASDCAKRALMGRVLRASAPPKAKIPAHTLVEATGAVLLPKAAKALSLACRCDPLVLIEAISSLDGTQTVPELSRTIDEVRTACLSPVAAHAYYRGKLLEATAQLVDWHVERMHRPSSPVKKADRVALARVTALMNRSLDRSISTDELCRAACMSATKLASLFRQVEGKTPQEFMRDLRMNEACRLLATTDRTIAEIATAIGYSRQSSFSEAFKSCHGMSPRVYRIVQGPR